MTQVFLERDVAPVTVLDYSSYRVVETNSGVKYHAIGYKKQPSKSEIGIFGKDNVPVYYMQVNQKGGETKVSPDSLNEGDVVNLRSTSKGKGFAGVVKRWRMKGSSVTHGASDKVRAVGSIGAGTTMGRVFKGKRMAGRKGGEVCNLRRVLVVSNDKENKIILLKGAVPGAYNSLVKIEEYGY